MASLLKNIEKGAEKLGSGIANVGNSVANNKIVQGIASVSPSTMGAMAAGKALGAAKEGVKGVENYVNDVNTKGLSQANANVGKAIVGDKHDESKDQSASDKSLAKGLKEYKKEPDNTKQGVQLSKDIESGAVSNTNPMDAQLAQAIGSKSYAKGGNSDTVNVQTNAPHNYSDNEAGRTGQQGTNQFQTPEGSQKPMGSSEGVQHYATTNGPFNNSNIDSTSFNDPNAVGARVQRGVNGGY